MAAVGSATLLVAGTAGIVVHRHDQPPSDVALTTITPTAKAQVPDQATPKAGVAVQSHKITLAHLPPPGGNEPTSLRVPTVNIAGPIQAVGTDPRTHLLRVPHTTTRVVWWAYGAAPGDPHGSVVLAAHVDYNGKLGLFFNLDRTPIGAIVDVRERNGADTAYRVVSRQHVGKPDLHRLGLFTRRGRPRLVLITCGGSFDAAKRSYRDNIVVTAQPVT